LLRRYFPGLTDPAAIDALLADDIDVGAVLAASRPPGAPEPTSEPAASSRRDKPGGLSEEIGPPGLPSETDYRQLVTGADAARGRGNVVRAAILRMQAAAVAQPKRDRGARNAAKAELALLVDRLTPALGLDEADAKLWRQVLPSLLGPAAQGVWPVEARLLYDLQKVCLDYERELYAIDLVEWVRSLFRRPIKRPLPEQREVLLLKHLRSAALRLRTARLPEADRHQLGQLFLTAVTRKEKELRQHLRPIVVTVFNESGLVPANLPERVARDKVVEELLDHFVENGFTSLGDLRDIVARSQLKLPDLAGPAELYRGDELLRADKQLGVALDGVHRRGEWYRRLFQRISLTAFGTKFGRFLTLYLILPFAGAYAAIIGVMEIIDIVAEYILRIPHFHSIRWMRPLVHDWAVDLAGTNRYVHIPEDLDREEARQLIHSDRLRNWENGLSRGLLTVVLGVFFFLLLHVPPFRRGVFTVLRWTGRGFHALVIDLPRAVFHWSPLRSVLDSRAFAVVSYYLLKPGLAAALAWLVLWLRGAHGSVDTWFPLAAFFAVNLLLNSRMGRSLEEIVSDRLERGWQKLSVEIVPELIYFIIDLFKRLLGAFDRWMYSVDEWLRFRGGQKRSSLIGKAILGLVWFVVAYAVRGIVVVFVEPTFNPIKHFPTVTVTAKLMLPFAPDWVPAFGAPLAVFGPWVANSFGTVVFLLLPGLAGFLVWEFKENWRLYAANRPRSLRSVMVGSHGETLSRLLRPGFHSGTLPKLYAKLRKAERRAGRRRGAAERVRTYRLRLHHISENVRHFFEREFLALINASTFWRDTPLSQGQVDLSANRIRVEFPCSALGPASLWLSFEERSGWLLAGVNRPDWLLGLASEQRGALATALAGLYKLAGVNLVRRQVESLLPADASSYDIVEEGLAVEMGPHEVEAIYPLETDEEMVVPRLTSGALPEPLPALPVVPLRFDRVAVPWDWWVSAWEGDLAGKPHPVLPVPGLRLLPGADDAPVRSHLLRTNQ
jgi:hypothetical protein